MVDIADSQIPINQQLLEAKRVIRNRTALNPRVGLMLGSGLGALVDAIEVDSEIEYEAIPHMPISTAPGHKGSLVFGSIDSIPTLAFSGRCHYYEGYAPEQIVYPVRLMRALGVEVVILTSIVGSMNPAMPIGSLVLLDDHINLMGINPLIGPNDESLGPRFPDMSFPYDAVLQGLSRNAAKALSIDLKTGVYVGVAGPNLETRAEYRMLRQMGADVVGMSVVPEVIAARHCGLRVLAVTVVSDACLPDELQPVDVDELLRVAADTEPKLTKLLREVIKQL